MSAPAPERLTVSRVLSHLGVMTAVSVVLGVVTAGLMIPFAGVVGMGARDVAASIDSLPAELETKALPQRTRILDANNKLVATLYDENRVNVSLAQVSRTMVKAIVAIEDYRFYEHGALDLKGTLRALVTNQANSGVVQGGSSITQQMVKLTLVQQAETEEERKAATDDTYARKLRELRYAIAVEENYSKDWILERYLNIAYFGDGSYGIQAAARHYFNKNAKKLNLRESAMLAGLVKNPTGYDPTNSPSRALARRNVVLDRMAQLNVITPEEQERARESKLGLRTVNAKNGCVNSTAAFFCDYVVQYLLKDPSLGKTEQDRRNLLQTGGLTIRTTLDQRYQDAADASVAEAVYPTDQAIGGLTMVEPGTGAVKAVAQSRPMGRSKAEGQTFLNYAVNQKYGDSKGFQGGSTFKPFVLAAAVEQGISLATAIPSPDDMVLSESLFEDCDGEPYGYGTWPVGNSTSSGTMNLYTGTRLSVNTFYAQLMAMTGICEPFQLAKKMGLDLDNPVGKKPGSAERVPSFTLGVPDVSPLEMAEAYATFGARGLHCDSRPVEEIQDSQGNSLKQYPARCTRVMEETTADAVNDVLRGVIEGGFASAQALGQPAAGKTGTTQSNRAVWFVGYTPNLAAASMIAGANEFGSPQELTGVMVGGSPLYDVSGSGTAGPMWGDAMKVIAQWLDDESFVYPSSVPGAGSTYIPAPTPPPSSGGDTGGGGGGGNDGGGNGGGNGGGGGRGRG
ncbi:transglycosylase domain-containing protein [Nocardioides pacificus]